MMLSVKIVLPAISVYLEMKFIFYLNCYLTGLITHFSLGHAQLCVAFCEIIQNIELAHL